MSDIALVISNYEFDLEIENGDLKFDEGLETAISISLFSDRRVTDEELPELAESKRGWWGDLFPELEGDKIGSRLWTLMREKRLVETLRRAEDYAKEALKWLLDDGIVESIVVTAEFDGEPIEGRLFMQIDITRPPGRESRYQVIWDQQAVIRG